MTFACLLRLCMRYAIRRTGAGYRRGPKKEGAREARPEGPARRGTCPRGAEPEKRGESGPLSWTLAKKDKPTNMGASRAAASRQLFGRAAVTPEAEKWSRQPMYKKTLEKKKQKAKKKLFVHGGVGDS